jgi:hypothetical protein
MVHPPTAVGLIVCERIIIEETTRHRTLVNSMTSVRFPTFPSPPQRIEVYAVLRDGQGEGMMSFTVTRLDLLEEIVEYSWPIRFRDPLHVVQVMLTLPGLSFPAPGRYQFALVADGDLVAQTFLTAGS